MAERIVDLGLDLTPGLKTWDVKPPFTILPYMTAQTFALGFNTRLLIMEDHTGTHVDATLHFYDGEHRSPRGKSIAEMPLEKLIGDAVLIDVSAKDRGEPVTRSLLEARAAEQGVEIRRGDIVLVRFWPKPWGEPMGEFLDARGLELDACEWLLEKGVKAVGVDHANLEGKLAKEFGNFDAPGHILFLHPAREIPIMENLVNLDRIGRSRFRFAALPLKMHGATGSPIRAVAMVES
ncbi:MAG: putative metal-dependent hydrolase [candidate division NC10 bacterium]|jgi:kynurenine formamidase|nr:putative metal-dependent hydrolase [candidate division NC10 bacterium]